ncbi:MAG: rubrerythrin family protein [Clostridium sp.]|uniref:rubrerythrin n=1 Tax=Clostridium sp. TaxID=1506 RepID=UPI0030294025
MNFKDSETKINLMRSFAGESQARNRYTFAASAAKKEGLYVIQNAFLYTANQELAHANQFYKKLKEEAGNVIEIGGGAYPVDLYDSTLKLLKSAHHNEYEEYDDVYKKFSEIAKQEGFTAISTLFTNIASIEKIHGDRFNWFATQLEENTLFKRDTSIQWQCTNCGFIYEGKEVPKYCPVCEHPQGYFIEFCRAEFGSNFS